MVNPRAMEKPRPKSAKGARLAPQKAAKKAVEIPGLAARCAALDVLTLVRNGRTIDEALEECRSFNALEGPDRGFAHVLAAGVLRRRGAIDHVIGLYIDRPLPKRSERATDILRLAAVQTLFLGTPAHAAVSTAVALTEEFGETENYAGLVNAVARKVAATGPAVLAKLPERIDTPGWMWRSWERAYGPETTRSIARAHASEAPLDLTPRDPADAEALARDSGGALLATGSVRLPAGSKVTSLPGFDDGRFWVQDAAAAIPARLLGDVHGKRVFDLCAAPGGKTMQLAAAGADVIAVDISGDRLKRVVENLERTKLTALTVKADVATWEPAAPADAVLLDAPCTATGTIRRHPDILWAKNEDSLKETTALQARMIDRARAITAPGGTIVYCVCSLQPEEGEKQIAAALTRHDDLARVPLRPEEVGGLLAINRDGDLRTLPSMLATEGGIDGFFAARLIRC
jgi:16S rRNA (cytosine967-C5)-methyltransferase